MLFLLKHKKQPFQQACGGETSNLVLKRMLELFLKVPPLKKMLEFQNQKKTMKFVQKENFEQNIKPMIENLQNELCQLGNKQKVLNFVLTLGRSLRAKKAPILSSEDLKERICKFKQYLNYILMTINQNILKSFLNLQNKL